MRPVYLLDTNIVSEPLKPMPEPGVMERLRTYDGLICISAVVWHELLFGMSRLDKGARKQRVQAYLFDVVAPACPVIEYDASSASVHATVRAQTTAGGHILSFADGVIASTAVAHNLVLVTRNTKDFHGITGLYLENWFGSAASAAGVATEE
ncbi:MAG: type II toxin-antitoxin system VapC family toxin [Spirochaeta sp.]|nr:type II toxin-antitoxin system VapC family toxin [Spirochaeta sp.]